MESFRSIDKNPPFRTLLSFALALAIGAGLYALYSRHHDQPNVARWVLIAGGCLATLALIRPIGRWLYAGWMGLGIAIGMVTSPIILGAMYLVLFVPVALVFRLRGRDKLRLKKSETQSYWENYPEADDPASYLKQY